MISLLCSESFSEDLIMASRAAVVLSTHDLPDCLPGLHGAPPSPQAVSCLRVLAQAFSCANEFFTQLSPAS